MTAYGYARRSRGESDTQQALLHESGVDQVFVDDSTSGVTTPDSRPGWTALMQTLGKGDSLTVRELARISRRRTHQQAAMRALHASGVELHSLFPSEEHFLSYFFNPGVAANAGPMELGIAEAVLGIMAAVAEMEWQQISAASRAGQKRAQEAGKHIGRPQLGEHGVEIIRLLAKEGHNVSEIARRTRYSRSTVAKYIDDPTAAVPAERALSATAGRPGLSQTKQARILNLLQQGQSVETVARSCGVSASTVRKYGMVKELGPPRIAPLIPLGDAHHDHEPTAATGFQSGLDRRDDGRDGRIIGALAGGDVPARPLAAVRCPGALFPRVHRVRAVLAAPLSLTANALADRPEPLPAAFYAKTPFPPVDKAYTLGV